VQEKADQRSQALKFCIAVYVYGHRYNMRYRRYQFTERYKIIAQNMP